MGQLDPTLAAALAQDRVLLFGGVEIGFPGGTMYLLDGSAEVMIGSNKFVGRDPVWGVLDTIKGLADTTEDQAPVLTIGIIPASTLSLAAMLDPSSQGSPVIVSVGVVNPATGLAVGQPYVIFVGELDVPTVRWAANDRRLEFRVTGIGERLFNLEEGRRLSDAFHQMVWPGELGLAFVTGIEDWVAWGQQLRISAPETRTNLPSMGMISYQRYS